MKDIVIVGIDPGITAAVAILDINGNILDIYSKRDVSKTEIIRHILRFGNPVIIASDVSVTPQAVEKIAAKFGCVIYSPDISLSLKEKRELTKEYNQLLKNDHEVDALAAAIKAWKQHRTLFEKVSDDLKELDKKELLADVVMKIMKEGTPNIEQAINEFVGKEKTPIIETVSKKKGIDDKLQKKLVEKQQQIDQLQNENILLSKALNEVRKELGALKKCDFRTIQTKDYQQLKNQIDTIKKLRRIEFRGYYPIVEIDQVTGDLMDSINDTIDLYGRVVMVNKRGNLNLLNNMGIKCLITFDALDSNIENLEFPVLQVTEDMIEEIDDIKAIKIDYIEKRLVGAKKSGLIEWLKGYRKRKD